MDKFWTDPVSGNPGYRIRATGMAKVLGLPRTGMDDRMSLTTRGDNLLRKIDSRIDHLPFHLRLRRRFAHGDPFGGQWHRPNATVASLQITRRIELIAVPFEGGLKCTGGFNGPGSPARRCMGAIVCKSYTGNGNTGFHFDKALWGKAGPPVEYRIASYIEDIR